MPPARYPGTCKNCNRYTLLHLRYCCRRCYWQLVTAVQKGKTTWAELEAAGRAAPPRKGWPEHRRNYPRREPT